MAGRAACNQRGFTLVELVAVIVLLGIVAVTSTQFIRSSVGIYADSQRRDKLTQIGRFAIERISRELRNALPGSVRVRSSASLYCVEFTPIVTATDYLNNLAGTTVSTIDVVDFLDPLAASFGDDTVVIYPINGNSFYAGGGQYRVGLASVSAATNGIRTLTLDNSFRFNQDSPQRRVYIVEQPVSFCASDNRLMRYQGDSGAYTYTASQPFPPSAGGVLLAEFIRLQDEGGNAIEVFDYTNGTPFRNAVITMDLRFQDLAASDERVSFSQQVFLRNTQ